MEIMMENLHKIKVEHIIGHMQECPDEWSVEPLGYLRLTGKLYGGSNLVVRISNNQAKIYVNGQGVPFEKAFEESLILTGEALRGNAINEHTKRLNSYLKARSKGEVL